MKTNRALIIVIVFLVIWNSILSIQILTNQDNTEKENISNVEVTGFSTDFSKIASLIRPGSVAINSQGTISSGFVYSNFDGGFYVVTSAHGIIDKQNISVILESDKKVSGEFIGEDIFLDIAVIKVMDNVFVPAVKIGDSELVNDGEYLLSVGTASSLEFRNSLAVTMVSSKLRTIQNSITVESFSHYYYLDAIQLSGDITNGYSGAGIFNMNAEIVGIITMKAQNEVIAIPINEIKLVVDHLIANEEVTKLMFDLKGNYVANMETYTKSNLGINLETVSGIYVSNTLPGSLASIVGIKPGDIIISINDIEMKDHDDYLKVCYSGVKDYTIKLTRDTETIELKGFVE